MGRTQCAYDFPRSRGEVVSRMERLGARSKTAYRESGINRFNPTAITLISWVSCSTFHNGTSEDSASVRLPPDGYVQTRLPCTTRDTARILVVSAVEIICKSSEVVAMERRQATL